MKTKIIEITIDEHAEAINVQMLFDTILCLLAAFDIPSSCVELRDGEEVGDEG